MLSVLICDDSMVARKQAARCLPQDLESQVHFAKHGQEALDALKVGKGQLLLLDLNMPVMDGYETLENIQAQEIDVKTIVVSGDIQPDAVQRVKDLGALEFIEKPINVDELRAAFTRHGFFSEEEIAVEEESELDEVVRDCYQEVANVAMGRAGDHLARIMNVFVELPIPNVNLIEVSELHMMLSDIDASESTSGVCQGFLGDGISGEGLCILSDSSFSDIAKITGMDHDVDDQLQLELLMDAASLLIGTCLSGFAEQLDMKFRQGHPVVLGQHQSIQELIRSNSNAWKKTLAVEISYGLEGFDVKCDMILLFTEESMDLMNAKLSHLLED